MQVQCPDGALPAQRLDPRTRATVRGGDAENRIGKDIPERDEREDASDGDRAGEQRGALKRYLTLDALEAVRGLDDKL
jgi:hypothetical protein